MSVDVGGSGIREAELVCEGARGGEVWGLTGRHGGGEDGQEGGGWCGRGGGRGIRGGGGYGGDGEWAVDERGVEGYIRVVEGDVTGGSIGGEGGADFGFPPGKEIVAEDEQVAAFDDEEAVAVWAAGDGEDDGDVSQAE